MADRTRIDVDERKTCNGCGEAQVLVNFPMQRNGRRRGMCRACIAEQRVLRRIALGQRRPDPEPGHKYCGKCEAEKPLTEFYFRQTGPQAGKPHAHCQECTRAGNQARARRNGVQPFTPADGLYVRRKRLSRYELTLSDYDRMLADQGGVCAGCGLTPEENGRSFAVDHDHSCCPEDRSCGRCVRGLLCAGCNFAVGHSKDDPAVLRNLASYLERVRH